MGNKLLFRFFRIIGIQQDKPAEMVVTVQVEFGKYDSEVAWPGADDFSLCLDYRRMRVPIQPDNDPAVSSGRRRVSGGNVQPDHADIDPLIRPDDPPLDEDFDSRLEKYPDEFSVIILLLCHIRLFGLQLISIIAMVSIGCR
jgi:hypothetical protein